MELPAFPLSSCRSSQDVFCISRMLCKPSTGHNKYHRGSRPCGWKYTGGVLLTSLRLCTGTRSSFPGSGLEFPLIPTEHCLFLWKRCPIPPCSVLTSLFCVTVSSPAVRHVPAGLESKWLQSNDSEKSKKKIQLICPLQLGQSRFEIKTSAGRKGP